MSAKPLSPPPPKAPPKSSASQGSSEGNSNKVVWIAHDSEVWTHGEIVKENEETNRVRVLNATKKIELEIPKEQCHKVNPSVVEDMSSLHYLHEPGILCNLKQRYAQKQIYTYMGAAMIAVNPFQLISQPQMSDYSQPGKSNSAIAHPYAIAENAYRNLNVLKRDQSIVISGESGSGKTETAKIIVKYLADRNRDSILDAAAKSKVKSPSASIAAPTGGDQLYEQLQGLSPILESFGNAKTSRNANSSRFGKFMKLNFELLPVKLTAAKRGYRMELTGSLIETYLLEKQRIVYQNDNEQNFHIFYSLLQHPPKGLEHYLYHSNTKQLLNFRIAKKSEPPSSGATSKQSQQALTLDESHYLQEVEQSMKVLGLTAQQIQEIWRILIALLYLGNVVIEQYDTLEGPISRISSKIPNSDDGTGGYNAGYSGMKYLEIAAELLQVEVEALRLLITQRQMETRGEIFHVPLNVRDAKFAVDAIAKAIYESLFAYLVRVMNKVIDAKKAGASHDDDDDNENRRFIGVLDIFGFESFAKNGFEQLLINYANEALQNTFNKQIFDKEKLLFEEEKIEDMKIGDCPSNLECVNLISMKGESIFSKLDSISRQPNPSDGRFCEELHKAFTKKNKYFGSVHRKDMSHLFVVNHYAAPVAYTVGNIPVASSGAGNNAVTAAASSSDNAWISKNNDAVPDGLESLFLSSELHQFQLLSAAAVIGVELIPGKKPPVHDLKRRKSVMMKPTIVEVFSKSMRDLNFVLDASNCHFIRCIKPNSASKAGEFDMKYVVEQVRALGILQACEVLSVGLPTRIPYEELKNALQSTVQRIEHLFVDAIAASSHDGEEKSTDVLLISSLLKAYQIPTDSYRLGVTIAFFKSGQLATLEQIFNQDITPEREAEIIHSIETSVQQYTRVMTEIANGQDQLKIAIEFAEELEQRQERLRDNLSNIPEVRGLDIPDHIANKISAIEQQVNKMKNQQNEVIRHKSQVEQLLIEKSIDLSTSMCNGKEINTKDKTVLDLKAIQEFLKMFDQLEKKFVVVNEDHQLIQRSISDLEELQSSSSNAHHLHEVIESNDLLYEDLMDRVSKAEGYLQEVTIFAERGNVDDAYQSFEKMNEELTCVNMTSLELSQAIQVASESLKSIEDSIVNINFDGVERLLDQSSAHFSDLKKSVGSYNDKLNSFLVSLQNFVMVEDIPEEDPEPEPVTVQAIVEPVAAMNISSLPPPPVKRPSAAPPATADGGVTAKTRSPSISYGVKDLANLRRRTSLDSTTSDTSAATTNTSTSESVSSERDASSSASASNKKSSSSDLPPNWKEMVDPKTNRPYYVNKVTKERQWKRPTMDTSLAPIAEAPTSSVPATASAAEKSPAPTGETAKASSAPTAGKSKTSGKSSTESAASMTSATSATSKAAASGEKPVPPPRPKKVSKEGDSQTPSFPPSLPPGWREALDKKTNRVYYVNDITKQRQWRRPEAESQPAERPLSVKESSIENVDRRASRRMSTRMVLGPITSPIKSKTKEEQEEEERKAIREMFNTVDLVVETVTRARRVSNMIMSEELLGDAELDEGAMDTVSYMMRIGTRDKTGYLMKQSKLLGRWRKRFFVLQEQTFSYYDSEKDYLNKTAKSKGEKVFQLRGNSQTSYTTTENCLSITNPNDSDDDDSSWYVLANNEKDLDEWMRAINAHIHIQFLNENNLRGRDFWEEGTVTVSIWKVPNSSVAGAQRRPVGIRTLPMVNGPRSGEGLYPGDVVEIVQQIKESKTDKNQTYLRLANDRGWVFEMHPNADYAIMVPAGGEVVEKVLYYTYSSDFLEYLQIYSTPHCHPDSLISSAEAGIVETSIAPGTMVEGCAEWRIVSNQLYASGESEYDEDEPFTLVFVKLRDGRGWVPMYHPVTGGQLLIPIEPKSAIKKK